MRVQLLSDLHLEFYPDGGRAFIEALDPSDVEVLVLAGDISLATSGHLRRVMDWFCAKYPEVVLVLGNHEYYNHSVEGTLSEVADIAAGLPNLHWLENSTVEIGGQRFVGSSLWFPDMPDGLNYHYSKGLNDFYTISGFREWVYGRNTESVAFLEATVAPGDVVVTHHIPTFEGVHPRWHTSQRTLGRFFLCQMSKEVLNKPSFWFYGHTHDSMAFKLGDCEFRCNPFGYYQREENRLFAQKLIMGGTGTLTCKLCGHKAEFPSDHAAIQVEVECEGCSMDMLTGEVMGTNPKLRQR